jgi:Putative zinc-binding metallo-peptidase
MASPLSPERERQLLGARFRDLGLAIAGSRLEPGVAAFQRELERAGVVRLKPHFYLSTEWGVPFGTVSIAIPFYLARTDLMALHLKQVGFLEGAGRGDLLRYLRHEMGHVVNYAYRLHGQADWANLFGPIEKEYEEEYRPEPFCSRYVRHLPGWYAQKHPDEDWAETFAVWMTPGYDWRSAYADWPVALAKLEWCDRAMRDLNRRDPAVTAVDADEDVSVWDATVQWFYDNYDAGDADDESTADETAGGGEEDPLPPALDGALQSIFEEVGDYEDVSSTAPRLPAGDLIRRHEADLVAMAYRWTGHFPERARTLVRHLAERADQLRQVYPADRETQAVIALTTLVTMLAMNHVHRGTYLT